MLELKLLTLFPNVDFFDFKDVFKAAAPEVFLQTLGAKSCEGKHQDPPDLKTHHKDFGNLTDFTELQNHLRDNLENSSCEYLIRTSWGEQEPTSWMPASVVIPMIRSITSLVPMDFDTSRPEE